MAFTDYRYFEKLSFYPLVKTVVDTVAYMYSLDDRKSFRFFLAPETLHNDRQCVLLRFEGCHGGRTLECLNCCLEVNNKVHYGVPLTVLDITSHLREYANAILVRMVTAPHPVNMRMCVQVVQKLGNRELLSLASQHGDATQDASCTRKLATLVLSAGDADDATVEEVRVSLSCPLLKTRIVVPSRGKNCKHLQCFDASGYLRLNESNLHPRWRCPVCDRNLATGEMRVDLFTMDVLKSAPESCEQVQIFQDGLWKPVAECFNAILDVDALIVDLTLDTSLCSLE